MLDASGEEEMFMVPGAKAGDGEDGEDGDALNYSESFASYGGEGASESDGAERPGGAAAFTPLARGAQPEQEPTTELEPEPVAAAVGAAHDEALDVGEASGIMSEASFMMDASGEEEMFMVPGAKAEDGEDGAAQTAALEEEEEEEVHTQHDIESRVDALTDAIFSQLVREALASVPTARALRSVNVTHEPQPVAATAAKLAGEQAAAAKLAENQAAAAKLAQEQAAAEAAMAAAKLAEEQAVAVAAAAARAERQAAEAAEKLAEEQAEAAAAAAKAARRQLLRAQGAERRAARTAPGCSLSH